MTEEMLSLYSHTSMLRQVDGLPDGLGLWVYFRPHVSFSPTNVLKESYTNPHIDTLTGPSYKKKISLYFPTCIKSKIFKSLPY